MDNTKKQPMRDEELAKISGGKRIWDKRPGCCPFCGKELNTSSVTHPDVCRKNPKNM